jgi:hypothetical protein
VSTPSTVTRTDDASGDTFSTRTQGSGALTQSVHRDPEVQGDVLSWYATGNAAESVKNDVVSGAGRLFKVDCVLLSTVVSNRYLHVFNALTATGTPVLRAFIPAGGQVSLDLGMWGRVFTTGISVGISTTLATYTSPGVGEGFFQVGYL